MALFFYADLLKETHTTDKALRHPHLIVQLISDTQHVCKPGCIYLSPENSVGVRILLLWLMIN